MKKLLSLITVVICGLLLIASCDEKCNIDIDSAPTPISIIAKDAAGNNLLDPEFECNILDNDIKVIYRGEVYPLIRSEYDSSDEYDEMGLYIGQVGKDKIPGIMFWSFYINSDRGSSEFTLSWGDGISDNIKFDYYYKVVKCEPKSYVKTYLNGELESDKELIVVMIKS